MQTSPLELAIGKAATWSLLLGRELIGRGRGGPSTLLGHPLAPLQVEMWQEVRRLLGRSVSPLALLWLPHSELPGQSEHPTQPRLFGSSLGSGSR